MNPLVSRQRRGLEKREFDEQTRRDATMQRDLVAEEVSGTTKGKAPRCHTRGIEMLRFPISTFVISARRIAPIYHARFARIVRSINIPRAALVLRALGKLHNVG